MDFFHKSGLNAHNNNETAIHNWQFKMLITSVVNSNVYNYKAYKHLRNIFGGQKQSRHIYRKTEQICIFFFKHQEAPSFLHFRPIPTGTALSIATYHYYV